MSYSSRFSFFLKIKSSVQDRSSFFLRRVVGVVFVIVAVGVFSLSFFHEQVRWIDGFFDKTFYSFYLGVANFNSDVRAFRDDFTSIFKLIKESKNLKKENDSLKGLLASVSSINFENERLRKLSRFRFPNTRKIISTRLIVRGQDGQLGGAKIFAGSVDGVRQGQFVVSEEGILVGKVIDVGARMSKVLLITEQKFKLPVFFPRIKNRAILSGGNQKYLVIDFMENTDLPKKNDVVVTSGDDEQLPPNLNVGQVLIHEKEGPVVNLAVAPRNVDIVSVMELESK